jgi:hypothetical protein
MAVGAGELLVSIRNFSFSILVYLSTRLKGERMMKLFYPLFLLAALGILLKDSPRLLLTQRDAREISRRLDAIRKS